MNRRLVCMAVLSYMAFLLTGCETVEGKDTSFSVLYGATVIVSLLLLIGYIALIKKKNNWFLLLFSSVVVVNMGYFWLACSSSLSEALWANRMSYAGSVMLPLSIFLIILNVTDTAIKKATKIALFGTSVAVLFIAASPGVLDIYYKEVTFEIVNGTAVLNKVYGPLHPIYMVYLIGYFGLMVAAIIRASVKKKIDSVSHAVILAIAVFVNIGVWFIEQIAEFGFEMLSISYIISELFLLGLHIAINENQRLKELINTKEPIDSSIPEHIAAPIESENNQTDKFFDADKCERFIKGKERLTHTEKLIFDSHVAKIPTKEILATLNIKENTLKFHNKNIYGKLGVSSRKELVEIYKQINNSNTDKDKKQVSL